jgi:UPF0755 protein
LCIIGKDNKDLEKGWKPIMPDQESTRIVRKIVLSIIAILIILLVILGFSGYRFYVNALEPLDPESTEEIAVEIPRGSSRTDIARVLEEEGVIQSAFVFNYHVRFTGEEGFQAGYYLFSPSMSIDEIIASLQEGGTPIPENPTGTITIPEGYMLEQVAMIVESQTDYTVDDFMAIVEDDDFLAEQLETYPELLTDTMEAREDTRYTLEGYLYPATYEFFDDSTLESLIVQMIRRMNQAVEPYYEDISASEFTVHEILTLASFIEREGFRSEDRDLFSGVFHNRLEVGMPLQTDVSVTYALGEHQERITYADLEVDSPYNTYMYTGLGPGPVNNPDEDSIRAALYPAETDYMFFLADLQTREVYFSETYEQHLEYQEEYLRD